VLLLLQVCLSTVGVLGDISRNVETDLLPYCDEIMQLLIHNLGSNDVHRSIKPQVGACCLLARIRGKSCNRIWCAVCPLQILGFACTHALLGAQLG
jgi:hypothetical protein